MVATVSEPTGYGDSPDTSDSDVAPGGQQVEGQQDDGTSGSASLTTDDEAQQDDGVMRPGNEPD
jgi:hypothetical protein